MIEEKISFVYPTLIREGMQENVMYHPNISMQPDDASEKQTIAITAGFIFKNVGIYYMELGIYLDETSVIGKPTTAGKMETKYFQRDTSSPQLAIYSMFADEVDLSAKGVYRVIVRAYGSKDGTRDDDPVDEHECFFYVSHKESVSD